jgi:hypothetical protein
MAQTLRITILTTVSIFLIVWAALTLVLQRRFVRILKTNQPKLWISLWDPAASRLFQFRYSHWFWTGGFDRTGDPQLSHLGTRFYAAGIILGATFGVWVVSAWFCGLIQPR